MDDDLFNELMDSVKEAVAINKGEIKPTCSYIVDEPDIKAMREKLGMTQKEFAFRTGISPRALQNWEQGRRRPSGPAAALIRIIAHNPELAMEALKIRPVQTWP